METEGFEGQATLSGETCAVPASSRRGAGVTALIVAKKPGNAGGAKEGRKVEMDRTGRRTASPGLVPVWLDPAGEAEALARSYAEPPSSTIQMLMASVREVVENKDGTKFFTPSAEWKLAPSRRVGPSAPSWVTLPTGEPYAGDPHVRFGGRGRL